MAVGPITALEAAPDHIGVSPIQHAAWGLAVAPQANHQRAIVLPADRAEIEVVGIPPADILVLMPRELVQEVERSAVQRGPKPHRRLVACPGVGDGQVPAGRRPERLGMPADIHEDALGPGASDSQ